MLKSRVYYMVMLVFFPCIIFNIFGTAFSFARGCSASSSSSSSHSIPSSYQSTSPSQSKYRNQKNIDCQTQLSAEYSSSGIRSSNSIKGLASISLPLNKKTLFNRITFSWANDLLRLGNNRNSTNPLEITDLWKLNEYDQMGNVSQRFENYYLKELESISSSSLSSTKISSKNILIEFWSYPVTRAIVKMYKREFIVSGILKLLNTLVQFFPSILIAQILRLVTQGGKNPAVLMSKPFLRKGILLSVLLFVVLSAKTVLENAYFAKVINLGASVRGALSSAVYRKSLRLNPQGRQNFTTGEISNYIQLDTNRMEQVAGSIHTVWDGIFQIIGYTSLLLAFLGPSVFAGITALLIMIPLNAYFLNRLSELRAVNLKHTDNRVKLTNEILQGIRAIKSYNWEKPFLEQITKIRDAEISSMKIAANTRAILVSILSAAPSFVAVFTLSLYAFLGNELTPTKVFTALALFNQLRFPVIFFPLLLNTLADGKVSLIRLSSFLSSSELQNYVQNPNNLSIEFNHISNHTLPILSNNNSIEIIGGEFTWSSSPSSSSLSSLSRGRLQKVNISVKKGELVAIIGPVGSGKSMLISALLGELTIRNGTVMMNGRIAYVPQSSWIPNDSLRNVILFGRKHDEVKYFNAVRSCGLLKDLSNLEYGDETEIGERGVNLSGGQKQRLSIARAVYDDADIYLLDDPLSALDADVGQNVFDRCINGILSSKTRILVTHQLRILPQVDRIIVMNTTMDGSCEIIDQGTFKELYSRGYDLSKLVNTDEENSVVTSIPETSSMDTISNLHIHSKDIENTTTSMNNYDILSSTKESLHVSDMEGRSEIETGIGVGVDLGKVLSDHTDQDTKLYTDILPPTGAMIDCCHSADSIECIVNEEDIHSSSMNKIPQSVEKSLRRRLPGSSLPLPNPRVITTVDITNGKHMNKKNMILSNRSDILEKKNDEWNHGMKAATATTNTSMNVKKLITTEERGEGAVGWSIYKSYISSAKSPLLILSILASFALANVAQIGQLWVVSAWTSDIGYKKFPLSIYLFGMGLSASSVAIFNWSRTYLAYIVGANASKSLHFDMAKRVLRAPLSFFESTPVGRLMQRFSKDLDSMDQQLPGAFGQLVASALNIAGAMIAVCTVTPSFAFVMIPVFTIYFSITNYYRTVARELKRLDSISRSPIYAHFSETLGGLSVIRSFRRERLFQRTNEVKLDDNISAYYALKVIDRWLSLRLEFLGNIIVFFSSILAIVSGSKAGITGISLNNALSITSLLNWCVRNGAETESLMNSVERIIYTSTQTASEYHDTSLPIRYNNNILANSDKDDNSVKDNLDSYGLSKPQSDTELVSSAWPWKGGIIFDSVQMKYRDDFDPVLKAVSLQIKPGERIGVVGRTGSGKSSLFRALLRLTEIESGGIYIDGVDIRSIGLDTLRSAVSVIPQDPVLFSGSIRFNLDPFHLLTDDELWLALAKANLITTVKSLPGGLSYQVSEGGENFSAGQRQLICLARALVRNSKLLLLDEATSSVDMDTDILIQRAIREEFSKTLSTVLTIAHRLDTIMDADRILVMENGKVVEFDSPQVLLKNPSSLFAQLVSVENNQNSKNRKYMNTVMNRENSVLPTTGSNISHETNDYGSKTNEMDGLSSFQRGNNSSDSSSSNDNNNNNSNKSKSENKKSINDSSDTETELIIQSFT